jgi:hypothetical protein
MTITKLDRVISLRQIVVVRTVNLAIAIADLSEKGLRRAIG